MQPFFSSIESSVGTNLCADFILGKFDVPQFPMEWSIGVRGLVGFGILGNAFNWAAAGLWTLHKGMSFSPQTTIEYYLGVGPGIGGYTSMYNDTPFGVGFATFDGLAWKIVDHLWFQLEYDGIYGWNIFVHSISFGIRVTV